MKWEREKGEREPGGATDKRWEIVKREPQAQAIWITLYPSVFGSIGLAPVGKRREREEREERKREERVRKPLTEKERRKNRPSAIKDLISTKDPEESREVSLSAMTNSNNLSCFASTKKKL